MPDTSSRHRRKADHRRRPAEQQAGPLMVSGVEPVDGTWFETIDTQPVDEPLLALVPFPRQPT